MTDHHPVQHSVRVLTPCLIALAAGLPVAALHAQSPPASSELAPQEVRGERLDEGYGPTRASAGLRIEAPISETPVSVQVVPLGVMRDQGAQGLEEVYRNVSGVVEAGNTLNAQSELLPIIRGFESPVSFRDGMRATLVGAVDLFNIASVEVLKGPSSILFGAIEPGGILNFTTKKPLPRRAVSLRQEIGSYEHFRSTLDATGPLNADGSLLYRVNAAYTDAGSFRDELDLDRVAVAPVLTWRASADTAVIFDLSYTREEVPYDSGVPFGLDSEPLVPIDTFFGDPSLAGRTLEDLFVGYTLEHRLSEIFRLRNRFQFHRATPENEAIRHRGVGGERGSEMLGARYQNEARRDDEYQLVTDLLADFATGPVRHSAVTGVDLVHGRTRFDRFRQNLDPIEIAPGNRFEFTPPADAELAPAFRDELQWAALYFHDQMALLRDERLRLLVGGRLDYVDQEDRLSGETIDNTEFTGRVGALYQLTDWLSPYASVSQSFQPQGPDTRDRQGNLLDPETGIQHEAGLKLQAPDERLLATLSVYRIDKEDVAVFDNEFFNDTGEFAFFPGVDQRSQGVELDVAGRITDSLQVFANYAFTDTEVLRNAGDRASEGEPLGNVPEQTARLWLAYDFADGTALANLGVGGGIRYEDSRLAQFDRDVRLDDFVTADLAAWYRSPLAGGRTLVARLNLKNVTDRTFYTRASDRSIVHPGAPRSLLASIGVDF